MRILPSPLDIDAHENRHSGPYHGHEEEERVADVACGVRDQAYHERSDERARLRERNQQFSS